MSEIKEAICESTSVKYLVDLTTRIGTVNVKAYKENDPDVLQCYLLVTFSNRFILDESKTLIGDLLIKFKRTTKKFLDKKNNTTTTEKINHNNMDFFLNKDGDLMIYGEQSEVDRYSIDTNGDLIWTKIT